jgi:hypothetical protein
LGSRLDHRRSIAAQRHVCVRGKSERAHEAARHAVADDPIAVALQRGRAGAPTE